MYKRSRNKTLFVLPFIQSDNQTIYHSIYCCLALLITLIITLTLYLIKWRNYKCWLTLAIYMKPNRQLYTLQLPITLATFFETYI